MNVSQYHYRDGQWFPALPANDSSQLLLAFGSRQIIKFPFISQQIKNAFSHAQLIGCTTSGEISSTEVYDNSLVLTAVNLANTPIQVINTNINHHQSSFEAGLTLAKELPASLHEDVLRYALVISDGQLVNGTELVSGINEALPRDVLVTGGLAGDAERFSKTVVWHNEQCASGMIVVCGFYGNALRVGHGTLGGWSAFGPNRIITRSKGNILYELDGQPALDLYKNYLGDYSAELPSSALRFPLSLQLAEESESVVRTILSINEDDKSMVFAGDMPEGASAKLMKASNNSLIDGASIAAVGAVEKLQSAEARLALLISCVGRRLVLNQRTYEELEAVNDVTSDDCVKCGFYSYGEISPLLKGNHCRLHNQTMTITTFSEIVDA
ncbi:FIST signal transduction protein [Aliikangiella maris]|uniref:FIST N-terminal domain-containing protein n=2 Tax=Aliikangiella maris TaxID=3162458 RepID=A0ABV3MUN9_9GAMM